MILKRTLVTIALLFSVLSVAACSWLTPYQPNIQQGNVLSERMISQLKVGMSKEQVVSTLGNPILSNVFDRDHWIYAYTFQLHGGEITKKRLDLYFKGNTLVRIVNNYR